MSIANCDDVQLIVTARARSGRPIVVEYSIEVAPGLAAVGERLARSVVAAGDVGLGIPLGDEVTIEGREIFVEVAEEPLDAASEGWLDDRRPGCIHTRNAKPSTSLEVKTRQWNQP